MTPAKRYPTGPITPVGACDLLAGTKPMVAYRSYDDQIVFNLMGPLAYWDSTQPESIRLLDMKGLIPPWENIEQKGATQDGSTYVTTLYDPLEIDFTVLARGRNPQYTRQVIRDWIAAWDAKQPGELSWFTPELGRWWASMRWAKPPADPLTGGNFTRQKFSWKAKCYDAFWRTYDATGVFVYTYASDHDTFGYTTTDGLGDGWDIGYSGTGSGHLYANGQAATCTLTGGRAAAARNVGFASATDFQVVTMTIGPLDTWPAAVDTHLDLWARMKETGTPGQTGIRLRLGYTAKIVKKGGGWGGPVVTKTVYTPNLRLSFFIDGTETLLRQTDVTVPFAPNDQISLAVGGYGGVVRHYFVQRGAMETILSHTAPPTQRFAWATLLNVIEIGDGSALGEGFRGAGLGMQVDGADLPPMINTWTAGDSTAAEEGGYVALTNVGDQPMWPRFLLVGPGIFAIGDGPNATSAVVFGPLYENQVVEIQTDPRVRGVVDLSSVPATPQQQDRYAQVLADYQSFLRGQGAPLENASVFGIQPAQGNLYALLSGRFSKPIPAKLPGSTATPYQIAVAIEGGSAQSAILAAGTPMRRYPA